MSTKFIKAEDIRIGHVLVKADGKRFRVTSANTSVNPRTLVLDPTTRTVHMRDEDGVTRIVKVTFGKKFRVVA